MAESPAYAVCRDLHLDLNADETAKLFLEKGPADVWLRRTFARHRRAPATRLEWFERPLPIVGQVGPVITHPSLRKWKRPQDIAPFRAEGTIVGEMLRMARRTLNDDDDETHEPNCYLAEGWQYRELEKKAWKLGGHFLEGNSAATAIELLRAALTDFDLLTRNENRAAFWHSWQSHRHIVQARQASAIVKFRSDLLRRSSRRRVEKSSGTWT